MILTALPHAYSSGRQWASLTQILQSVSTRLVAGLISQQVITAQPDYSSHSAAVPEWMLEWGRCWKSEWVWVLFEVSSVLRSDCTVVHCSGGLSSYIALQCGRHWNKFTGGKREKRTFLYCILVWMDGFYICTFFPSILFSFFLVCVLVHWDTDCSHHSNKKYIGFLFMCELYSGTWHPRWY